jgi:hypothetical protein
MLDSTTPYRLLLLAVSVTAMACKTGTATDGASADAHESEAGAPAHPEADPCANLPSDVERACRLYQASGRMTAGNCCTQRDEPGCELESVQACVCQAAPDCCQGAWNETCVKAVSWWLCGTCGGRGEQGPECGTSVCDEDWCGSQYQDNCPAEWQDNAVCDCGCQFEDRACALRLGEGG